MKQEDFNALKTGENKEGIKWFERIFPRELMKLKTNCIKMKKWE